MISMTLEIKRKISFTGSGPGRYARDQDRNLWHVTVGAAMPEVFKPKPEEHDHHSMPMQKPN